MVVVSKKLSIIVFLEWQFRLISVSGFLNPHSDPYSRSISNHGLMDQIAGKHHDFPCSFQQRMYMLSIVQMWQNAIASFCKFCFWHICALRFYSRRLKKSHFSSTFFVCCVFQSGPSFNTMSYYSASLAPRECTGIWWGPNERDADGTRNGSCLCHFPDDIARCTGR